MYHRSEIAKSCSFTKPAHLLPQLPQHGVPHFNLLKTLLHLQWKETAVHELGPFHYCLAWATSSWSSRRASSVSLTSQPVWKWTIHCTSHTHAHACRQTVYPTSLTHTYTHTRSHMRISYYAVNYRGCMLVYVILHLHSHTNMHSWTDIIIRQMHKQGLSTRDPVIVAYNRDNNSTWTEGNKGCMVPPITVSSETQEQSYQQGDQLTLRQTRDKAEHRNPEYEPIQ